MYRHEGGRDQRVVALNRARPQPVPPDVARLASHLAHLLDDAIEVRGTGIGVRDFAGAFLGVEPVDLVASTSHLLGMRFHLAALALAEDLERHPPTRLIGEDVEEPPRWEQLDLGETSPPHPGRAGGGLARRHAGRRAPGGRGQPGLQPQRLRIGRLFAA